MILSIQQSNFSLHTILPIYAVGAMSYGFYRGYSYSSRVLKKDKDTENSASLTQNFINGITLGISSLILFPYNLRNIITRRSGEHDIL